MINSPVFPVLSFQVLEVCVENVKSALSAWQGGAKRLELCSSLSLGGLTPSLGLFTVVRKSLPPDCAIFVMIRANQCENFVYDKSEVEVMVEDVKLFRKNGANGFVFGCLNEEREIDEDSCSKLLQAAEGLPSTFHRAFDIVKDPEKSLETLMWLGFSRVLTSGQEENAFLGRDLIQKLVTKVEESGFNFVVMAGGGVTPGNLGEILKTTRVKEYHGSARGEVSSSERRGVFVTDKSVVQEMVEIGETFYKSQK